MANTKYTIQEILNLICKDKVVEEKYKNFCDNNDLEKRFIHTKYGQFIKFKYSEFTKYVNFMFKNEKKNKCNFNEFIVKSIDKKNKME